ncbi:NFAT activation molecule 1 [Danio aesculapii]|uniref:NFAT activation molecule 1 n=1 Tax=Danio aesculapii TaxID=1142201 RepID=UPI0024BFA9E7|nr:NFAT activation molecule 1 [Danio aesculapii]
MYAAKHVLRWIVILYCWHETQASLSIDMLNRTIVALAGDTLEFNLKVVIAANSSLKLECYTQKRNIWKKELNGGFHKETRTVPAHIKMHNNSSSGNYNFRYENQKVYWVVQVRDKGYEEPPDELHIDYIIMMAISGILLIFSVAGSLCILKSYKEKPPCRDDENEVAEQRAEESDDVIPDEDAGSASLYTALQYRSDSVYDTLHPDTTADEGNTVKNISHIKDCKVLEDEALDSIYENL